MYPLSCINLKAKKTDEYKALSAQAPYQSVGVYLLGKNHLIPAITWLASPLICVNARAFYNVDDNSVFFNLSSETSWSDNLYSDFGVYLSSGDHIKIESPSANDHFINLWP